MIDITWKIEILIYWLAISNISRGTISRSRGQSPRLQMNIFCMRQSTSCCAYLSLDEYVNLTNCRSQTVKHQMILTDEHSIEIAVSALFFLLRILCVTAKLDLIENLSNGPSLVCCMGCRWSTVRSTGKSIQEIRNVGIQNIKEEEGNASRCVWTDANWALGELYKVEYLLTGVIARVWWLFHETVLP